MKTYLRLLFDIDLNGDVRVVNHYIPFVVEGLIEPSDCYYC
jgi:hypothetical protein